MALVIVAVVVAFFGNCYHERIVPGADESEVERIMRRAKEDPTMGVEVFIKSDSDTYRVFRPVNGNEVEKSE